MCVVSEWDKRYADSDDWARANRGVERAVFLSEVETELHFADDGVIAGCLFDLTKAYCCFGWGPVSAAVCAESFPPLCAALTLSMAARPRCLRVPGGPIHSGIAPSGGLLAGDAFSGSLARCVLLAPVRQVRTQCRQAQVIQYVDDLRLTVIGAKGSQVALPSARAILGLASSLIRLGCLIS